MQIIQKIRDKGAAIVIGVIALSLIGFILMDANLGMNRNAGGDMGTLGKVNGQKIDKQELEDKVKMYGEQYQVRGAQMNMLRQQVWEQMVRTRVEESEYEKLGITFSPKELTAIIFSDDAPYVLKQAFTNKETNQYDLAKVQQWWTTAKKWKGEQKQQLETQVVEPTTEEALRNKYSGLLAASAYYPSWLKEKESNEAKSFASISYVSVPYAAIADSTVKVSDEDITAYLTKHKAKYQQEGGRQVAYVSFSTNPSGADSVEVYQAVDALKANFAADSNNQAFLSRNSSQRNYDDIWEPKSKITGSAKDTLVKMPVGTVYGPYVDGSEMVLAKVVKIRMLGDSIKCRHILIGTVDRETGAALVSDSVAKQRADSIEVAIRGGTSFDALEATLSTDKEAHKTQGVMTFDIVTMQNPQGFAPEFAEFLLNDKGETRKVVKTNFGWHYIELMQVINPGPVYKIAYMSKDIAPGDETIRLANNNANKLFNEAKSLKAFDDYVAKNKLQKVETPEVLKESDYRVGNLPDAREVVRWAFNDAKEGSVGGPFNMNDQFVVPVLTKIIPKGLMDAKTARPQVEGLVRNSKKAEQIKAKLAGKNTLEAAAGVYPGVAVATAGADSSLVFSSSIINGVGQEPKVIGAAFNKANQQKISDPIEGNGGVFVVKVNSIGTKTIDVPATDKAKTLAQQFGYGWFEALKKEADIKDDRAKHY